MLKPKVVIFRLLTVLVLLVVMAVSPVCGKEKRGKAKRKSYPLTVEMTREIVERSGYYGLDSLLILEIARQESSFNPMACSSAGARGLMQFVPSTAKRFGITDPHNVAQSVDAGCQYVAFLIKKFNGRLDLVLAGYNAGEGAVEKYGNQVPPYDETRNYVRTIIANYKRALEVKQSFLVQNNISISTTQVNQVKPKAVIYNQMQVVNKKALTKKEIQKKLAELNDFSINAKE